MPEKKKDGTMKKSETKAPEKKAQKAEGEKAPIKEEKIASEKESEDIADLVALDKEEAQAKPEEAKPEETKPEENNQEENKTEEKKPEEETDQTQQALEQAANDDVAKDAEKDAKAAQESQSEMNKNVYEPLIKPAFEGDGCEAAIEEMRTKFSTGMKKSRRQSTLTLIILVIGLVLMFVLKQYLPTDLSWLIYVLLGILVVFLVVELILSSRNRKKLYANVDEFVKDAISEVDAYVFTDQEFIDTKVARAGHIDLSMLIEAHYFDTINAVNSRNIVRTTFLGKELTVSEIAARVPYADPMDDKDHSAEKKKPAESYGVFGKYITYPLALRDGASVIILMKGTNAYQPTFLDGYHQIAIPTLKASFLVWGTDDEITKEMINDDFAALINQYSSDQCLENMFLSINPHGLKICLNYNETVMEVPMEKALVGTPYIHYKGDVKRAAGLIKVLVAEGK
jgi:hypothetical protein